MLSGVVTAVMIERKVINLEFDNEQIDKWANSLVQNDKRLKGIQSFEWNDTETKEEKLAKRKKAIADAILQKKMEKQKKEYLEKKKQRDLERAEKKKIYEEIKKQREEDRRLRREQKEKERLEKEAAEGKEGEKDQNKTDTQEEESKDKDAESKPTVEKKALARKEKPQRGGHKGARGGTQMVFKRKDGKDSNTTETPAGQANEQVKDKESTMV